MTVDLICDDIMNWCAEYDGPPFHAVLCDAPYEIEFMNSEWDASGIAFNSETWQAIAAHLHPGAFLFVFAGTMNDDLIAGAMRRAGLEKHHSLSWIFGCLSDDTEILTPNGWQSHHSLVAGDTVLGYNVDSDTIEPMPIERVYRYAYSDTAYRIQSDTTDQLVSRNHRCLVERGGTYVYEKAEKLRKQETVPVLADMCYLRHDILALTMSYKANNDRDMQQQVSGEVEGARPGNIITPEKNSAQGQGGLDRAKHENVSTEYGGRKQPGMEGRRNLSQPQGQLSPVQHQIRALPAGISEHVSEGWLCYGASPISGATVGASPNPGGSSTPHGSQPGKQRTRQSDAIHQQRRPQELRRQRATRPTLATITPVEYTGIVWCVQVRSGAFVAQRNGKAFVTGNSGFPKSTRIDTQIDAAAGAEREVVGTKYAGIGRHGRSDFEVFCGNAREENKQVPITAPATPLARTWEGHRYGRQCIKPAHETILVFRKPYAGRTVDSIVATGAGSLWIDGARISHNEECRPMKSQERGNLVYRQAGRKEDTLELKPAGRWPPSVALSHRPECKRVGEKRVPGTGNRKGGIVETYSAQQGALSGYRPSVYYSDKPDWIGPNNPDGTETVAAYSCVDGCPIRALDEQAGERVTHSGKTVGTKAGATSIYGTKLTPEYDNMPGDRGGPSRYFATSDFAAETQERLAGLVVPGRYVSKASRGEREAGLHSFEQITVDDGREKSIDNPYQRGETKRRCSHPTIKPLELCTWLATLLCPPPEYVPRRLLVPFAGVASECIGAWQAGWDEIVGVELMPEYVEIGRARIEYWLKVGYQLELPGL